MNRRLQQSYTFSALRTNRTNNIKPLIFCLPDCSGTGACFCPSRGYHSLPDKACFILKPYLYKRNASFGYLGADANYTVVHRSHLTTRLIPLPRYTAHARRILCFLKSFGDNDMYAAVHRSHLTTRLIPFSGYDTRGRRMLCFFKLFGDNDMYAVVRRSHLTTHLILLPGYAAHVRSTAQSPGCQIYPVHSPSKPRIFLFAIKCLQLLCCVMIFDIHNSLHA